MVDALWIAGSVYLVLTVLACGAVIFLAILRCSSRSADPVQFWQAFARYSVAMFLLTCGAAWLALVSTDPTYGMSDAPRPGEPVYGSLEVLFLAIVAALTTRKVG